MPQNNYILPQQCRKCGAYFDLWYELSQDNEAMETIEIGERFGRKLAESLCWNCKQEVIEIVTQKEKQIESESTDDLLDLEIE